MSNTHIHGSFEATAQCCSHLSWLFQRIVPPVLMFALGSLGFLTNFDFANHQAVMDDEEDKVSDDKAEEEEDD